MDGRTDGGTDGRIYVCAFIYSFILLLVGELLRIGKGKVHPRTGHEGPEVERGITLLFL